MANWPTFPAMRQRVSRQSVLAKPMKSTVGKAQSLPLEIEYGIEPASLSDRNILMPIY